jgi:hypothetical protein
MIAAFQAAERGSIPRYCINTAYNRAYLSFLLIFATILMFTGDDDKLEDGSAVRFWVSGRGGRTKSLCNADWKFDYTAHTQNAFEV